MEETTHRSSMNRRISLCRHRHRIAHPTCGKFATTPEKTPYDPRTPRSQIKISLPVRSRHRIGEASDGVGAVRPALWRQPLGGGHLCSTAMLSEAIFWLLIYRTATYNSLRASIERHSRKLDALKSAASAGDGASGSSSTLGSSGAGATSSSGSRAKKMDRVETSLKDAAQELSLAKLKSGAVVAAVLFVVFDLLNSLFEGRAVATLPFAPVPLVQSMSHRGLPRTDPTDCSMVFLYFFCSMSIRTNLQKLLGFAPPRVAAAAAGGLFPMPDPKVN
ncbi:hypothetical protein ACP4OV_011690 [Aristida adscensionis]